MNELKYPQTKKWVVSHNNDGIFIGTVVESQNCFITGQPFMEVFDSREEANTAFPDVSAYFSFNLE